jgi:lipopolysaccharide export system protein LptA
MKFLIPQNFRWQHIIIALILVQFNLAFALKTDQNQPTKLSADKADFNDVNQEYILTGHVVIIKGSIVIKGSRSVVVVDPDGYQKITVVGDDQKLASFTQQLDKPTPEFMDGEGDLILYEAKNDQLLLTGHAYTARRQGSLWKDKLVADKIEYDLYTEEYKAISENSKKLTRTIIAPSQTLNPALTNLRK